MESGPICILCGGEIRRTSFKECQECASPHHSDCWVYMGGCSRYGCNQVRDPKARAAVSLWDLEGRLGSLLIEKHDSGLGVRVIGQNRGWWRRPPYIRILPGRVEVKGNYIPLRNVRIFVSAERPPTLSRLDEQTMGFSVVQNRRRVVVLRLQFGSSPSQVLSHFDSWRMGLRAAGRLNACLAIAAASF